MAKRITELEIELAEAKLQLRERAEWAGKDAEFQAAQADELRRLTQAYEGISQRAIATFEWNCTLTTALRNTEVEKLLLEEKVASLQHELFGRSSEKRKPESKPKPIPSITTEIEKHRPRKPEESTERRRKTLDLKNALPVETQIHPAPESKCHCPHCGDGPEQFRLIGKKATKVFTYIPGRLEAKRHELQTRKCHCGKTIVSAEPPAHFGQFNHEFVAQVITDKTENSLPIARQARSLSRTVGFNLPRQTVNRLFLKAGKALAPLASRILELIAQSEVVLADETFVTQQDQKKKAYIWTFNTDELVAYEYSSNRSGDTPTRILGASVGSLLVDAYSGYNAVTAPDKRKRANCNTHARRKFCEAQPTTPEAQPIIDLYLELFLVEQEAKERGIIGTEEHLALRRVKSRPIMDRLYACILAESERPHLPKGKMAMAIHYALNNWEALSRFLLDARIPISNNRSERLLRVVAQGRKSYLTIGNSKAGKHITTLYTLTACCIQSGIDPVEYYTDVLQRINTHPQSRLDELLPHHWKRLRNQSLAPQAQAA